MKKACFYTDDLQDLISAAIIKHWFMCSNDTLPVLKTFTFENYTFHNYVPTNLTFIKFGDIFYDSDLVFYDSDLAFYDRIYSLLPIPTKILDTYEKIDDLSDLNCREVWEYFILSPVPEMIKQLSIYYSGGEDVTEEEYNKSAYLFTGLNARITSYEEAYLYLRDMLDRDNGLNPNDNRLVQIINEGKEIMSNEISTSSEVSTNNLGARFNEGKLRWRNFPLFLIKPLMEVAQFGESKYDTYNFLKGGSQNQYLDCIKRHLEQFESPFEPDNDPESGVNHLAHVAWNALVAAYMLKYRPELDDRYFLPVK